jgi:hypothetical protein
MNPKTMKEEVEAIDRKVLAYCEAMEAALAPAAALKPEERVLRADQSFYLPPDGMDMVRSVHRQVLRARNLAWAVQRLPCLDLSFMSSMKKKTFKVRDRREGRDREVEIALPVWVATGYPGASYPVSQDPTKDEHQSSGFAGIKISIPTTVVEQNKAALGDTWLHPQAIVAEVPGALRRKIDPFVARFDTVAVIGEADWTAVPGADPLVVGIIYGSHDERHAFLLGEYDPTKLEKYIVAELAVKPRE